MKRKSPQTSILKILGRKKAVSVEDMKSKEAEPKAVYALSRSIKNMVESGLAELLPSDQGEFMRITPEGRQQLYRNELSSTDMPITKHWDGKWRMILLDLPEDRKSEREALRYLLKKAGFVAAKNSVWISPYPFEHFFGNIKKDLGLSTELMIIVTDTIDETTEKAFLKHFEK